MNYLLIPKELKPIAEKVEARQRISDADALALYRSNDLNALGMIANVVRERKNSNYATYSQSLHQLFQYLRPLLPILRFRREEARCTRL